MEPVDPLVQDYAGRFTSAVDEQLQGIITATASHPHAHMISGQVQGVFLQMLSMLLRPRAILEIGTFTGFSALCLATGLADGSRLHTIELREDDARTAQNNFNHSNYKDRIILHIGNALQVIPELDETWDLAFIDADKSAYLDYYRLIVPKMRPGGVIVADNVLFHGQVLTEPVTGRNARAIQAFNEFVKNDHRVQHVLLTVRDGLMLIRKK